MPSETLFAYFIGGWEFAVIGLWTLRFAANVRQCSQRSHRWQKAMMEWGSMPLITFIILIMFPWNLNARLITEALLSVTVFLWLFVGAGILDWLKEVRTTASH